MAYLILRRGFLALMLSLLLNCGGTSPYTSASGGSVPVGTTSFLVTAGNAPTSYTINGGNNPNLIVMARHRSDRASMSEMGGQN